VHLELIRRVLADSINLHHYLYEANVLTAHTRHDVIAHLQKTLSPDDGNAIWFVREVETARGERLINEAAHLRV
jgi:hypothetical protein